MPTETDRRFRIRVERILRNEFFIDDYKSLFLYARDRCEGRRFVKEIGDFIAHHDARDRGPVFLDAKDYQYIVDYMLWMFYPQRRFYDTHGLAPMVREVWAATLRRLHHREIVKAGFKPAEARVLLSSLSEKVILGAENFALFMSILSEKELALFELLDAKIIVRSVFDSDKLFDEFVLTLAHNKILENKEKEKFRIAKRNIALLGVSAMHNNTINLGVGKSQALTVGTDEKGMIVIAIDYSTQPGVEDWKGSVGFALYETNIPYESGLSSEIIAILRSGRIMDHEIELRADGMLHVLA